MTILQNPTQFKIPTWFLNRQKDITDGKNSQILSNAVDSKLRDDLERLKRMRNHRGIRHYWGVKVRGQHTKTTGRRGKTGGFYSRHEFGRWLIVFRRRCSWCAQEEVIYASSSSRSFAFAFAYPDSSVFDRCTIGKRDFGMDGRLGRKADAPRR